LAAFNAALDCHGRGDLHAAEARYLDVIGAHPGHAEALNQLGVLCAQTGRMAEGRTLIARATKLAPANAGAWNNLGTVLTQSGLALEAWQAYQRALALEPDNPETLNNAGAALKALGRLDAAAAHYRRAIDLGPPSAEVLSNYGNVLLDQERTIEAIEAHQRALKINPDYPPALNNLGAALRRQGRYEDALAALTRAVELAGDYGDALNNLGEVLKERGEAASALEYYRRAMAAAADQLTYHSNYLLALNCASQVSREEAFAAHAEFGKKFTTVPRPAQRQNQDGVLRVGYVSGDFRRHSVASFFEPVLACHDRNAFRVYCYCTGGGADAVTMRIQAHADRWRDIRGVSDAAAAAQVRADGIDILVDLCGHTAGGRLGLFAARPAAAQVNWLGYPNTTGLAAMDYRLTDAISDPEGDSEPFHTEQLVRLEGGFLCYQAPEDAPEPEPATTGRPITFGSCNNLAKVTDEVVEAWAEILDRLPDAQLVLKAKALADEGTRNRLGERLKARGAGAGRIEMTGWITDASHLEIYNRIDIALDTFPYTGTTTTCEALWMGCPVVTLAGDRHAARVGASLLSGLGLGDLIAAGRGAYIETATRLAQDREKLGKLRHALRQAMKSAALTDASAFTRRLEDAYQRMGGGMAAG